MECRCWRERVSLGDQNASWQTPVGEILRFQITAQIKSTNSSVVGACICSRWQGRAMGLRERFLTAGVAVPLALWAILYDARLCLSLVLVLQAICVQELHELLRRTRSGFVVPRFNRAPSSWVTASPVSCTCCCKVHQPLCCCAHHDALDCTAHFTAAQPVFTTRPGCLSSRINNQNLPHLRPRYIPTSASAAVVCSPLLHWP